VAQVDSFIEQEEPERGRNDAPRTIDDSNPHQKIGPTNSCLPAWNVISVYVAIGAQMAVLRLPLDKQYLTLGTTKTPHWPRRTVGDIKSKFLGDLEARAGSVQELGGSLHGGKERARSAMRTLDHPHR
jgi:hypothetical protein